MFLPFVVNKDEYNNRNSRDIEDTQTKMLKSPFCTTDFHLTPSLPGIRSNIRTDQTLPETRLSESRCTFFIAKTRVLGLSVGEDFVILACVVLTPYQRVTDGRSDRQLDRS